MFKFQPTVRELHVLVMFMISRNPVQGDRVKDNVEELN